MSKIYELVSEFKAKYPDTVAWRLKKHAAVVDHYINPDEKVLYAFCGQKNDNWADVFSSAVIVLTNKRLLIGQKRVVWGSFYTQITPDMYNDMQIYRGLVFGRITIDTIKERVVLTNLSKHSLDEIETAISEFMMKEKKKYKGHEKA
ncbi:MAG: hypothetical protein E7164_01210 [Firmicutes bacterium]|nr:hypothetical protein [Bacillota bacterium]